MSRSHPHRRRVRCLLMAILIASGGAAEAQSGPAPSLSERLAACAVIARDEARLACYDRVSAGLLPHPPAAAAANAPPPPPAAAGSAAPPPGAAVPDTADDFGLPPKPSPRAVEEVRREMTIAEVRRSPTRKLIFYMEDGQVWRQTDSTPLPPVRPGMKVSVEKGALGSYMLTVARRTIRVKRLK